MDIQTMYEKKATLWENAKNFLKEHTDDEGKMTAEDAATHDKMLADFDALSANIKRFERQEAMDKKLSQPATQPILNNPQDNFEVKTGRASDEYKKAALDALRTKFKNVSNILQEQVAADGGYLVPDEWDNQLITILQEDNAMRKLARTITTNGEHKMPFPAQRATAYLVAENQPITASNATFGQKTLNAYKLAAQTIVTNELLFDNAFELENFIITDFADALASKEEDLFINGTGTNQPTGLLTTAAADTTMIQQTSGANVAADDVINLVYKLPRPYRKNAVFLVNDATLAAIRKLKDANLAYMWQPSYQMGEPDRLLGYPVYTSPYMPTIAAGEMVLAFGDFSNYVIGDRGQRTFQQLNELYAPNFCTGYIMTERVDGILLVNQAVRVLQMKA